MSSYIHSTGEPRIIGEFDANQAQRFTKRHHPLLSPSNTYDILDAKTATVLLNKFNIDLWGLDPEEQDHFMEHVQCWVEDVAMRQADPDDMTNLWHIDSGTGKNVPLSFDLGSSSHPTDIICGDVMFDFTPRNLFDLRNQLRIRPLAQYAVERALEQGDAWLYTPEQPLEGKILRLTSPNIHRKSQSAPPYNARIVLRAPNFGS